MKPRSHSPPDQKVNSIRGVRAREVESCEGDSAGERVGGKCGDEGGRFDLNRFGFGVVEGKGQIRHPSPHAHVRACTRSFAFFHPPRAPRSVDEKEEVRWWW